MKCLSITVIFAFALLHYHVGGADSHNEKQKVQEILRAVETAGGKAALFELVKLRPEVGIPILQEYALNRTTDKDAALIAVQALRQIKGLGAYYRSKLDEAGASRGGESSTPQYFDVLALIANQDAIAAVAPSLFDTSKAEQLQSDVGVSDYKWQAASALTKMNLPDAPVHKIYYHLTNEDLDSWIKWAAARGYKGAGTNVAPITSAGAPAIGKGTQHEAQGENQVASSGVTQIAKEHSTMTEPLYILAFVLVTAFCAIVIVLSRRRA